MKQNKNCVAKESQKCTFADFFVNHIDLFVTLRQQKNAMVAKEINQQKAAIYFFYLSCVALTRVAGEKGRVKGVPTSFIGRFCCIYKQSKIIFSSKQ